MKITARIEGENQALVETLTQRGIKAKLVKGGVIVELPMRKELESDRETYEVPPEANDATLYIDVTEHGGARTNTGSATVVCDSSGKPLRPYYIGRHGHLACGTHAYFSVPHAVTITASRQDTIVKIEEHNIVRKGNIAWIESKVLWSGELEVLPNSFKQFKAAAEAAKAKANCYHCRCVHFAKLPKKRR